MSGGGGVVSASSRLIWCLGLGLGDAAYGEFARSHPPEEAGPLPGRLSLKDPCFIDCYRVVCKDKKREVSPEAHRRGRVRHVDPLLAGNGSGQQREPAERPRHAPPDCGAFKGGVDRQNGLGRRLSSNSLELESQATGSCESCNTKRGGHDTR
jgi:hypothetical protein